VLLSTAIQSTIQEGRGVVSGKLWRVFSKLSELQLQRRFRAEVLAKRPRGCRNPPSPDGSGNHRPRRGEALRSQLFFREENTGRSRFSVRRRVFRSVQKRTWRPGSIPGERSRRSTWQPNESFPLKLMTSDAMPLAVLCPDFEGKVFTFTT